MKRKKKWKISSQFFFEIICKRNKLSPIWNSTSFLVAFWAKCCTSMWSPPFTCGLYKWMPLCTEKQARASKYINPLMPPATIYIHSAVRTLFLYIFLVPKDETGMYDKTVSNLCCVCLDTQPCWLTAWYPGKSDDFGPVCGPGLSTFWVKMYAAARACF